MGIREGGNVKKCRPVVKEPSGGTLLFRCALPARGASVRPALFGDQRQLCLGAACTGCIQKASAPPTKSRALPRRCLHEVHPHTSNQFVLGNAFASALPARGASWRFRRLPPWRCPLPRRCLHEVHHSAYYRSMARLTFASALPARGASLAAFDVQMGLDLCLGAACTRCIARPPRCTPASSALPRRCLHEVHLLRKTAAMAVVTFASALPARGASRHTTATIHAVDLCLGAACTRCIC